MQASGFILSFSWDFTTKILITIIRLFIYKYNVQYFCCWFWSKKNAEPRFQMLGFCWDSKNGFLNKNFWQSIQSKTNVKRKTILLRYCFLGFFLQVCMLNFAFFFLFDWQLYSYLLVCLRLKKMLINFNLQFFYFSKLNTYWVITISIVFFSYFSVYSNFSFISL